MEKMLAGLGLIGMVILYEYAGEVSSLWAQCALGFLAGLSAVLAVNAIVAAARKNR